LDNEFCLSALSFFYNDPNDTNTIVEYFLVMM